MKTVYSPAHKNHQPAQEFFEAKLIPFQETATRAENILQAVRAANLGEVISPRDFGLAPILAAHDADYITYLQGAYAVWVQAGLDEVGVYADTFPIRKMPHKPSGPLGQAGFYAMDLTAVIVRGTWQAAYSSAQCALMAAQLVANGDRAAFALCRPPGHHAQRDLAGGYCFINNAAVAANWLAQAGAKVAVLDVDFHHGNGTQEIFYQRDDALFVSIHAHPDRQYPYFSGGADERGTGRGRGFNFNYPLEKGVSDARYLAVLDGACADVTRFAPNFLVVSLGVDTFGGDPLGDFALTGAAFAQIGARIAKLNLPTAFVMEGGYAVDALGQNVLGVLRGFEEE
ncbi:MAG TPA: histone deacetylase family protein [Thermoflexales bacterium]|nr:histone deacetylase family protein [Thermoflexales bacterium]HQW36393.1 histone deacetylase family protein [Thermoflexales bacterium]HQX75523.1 histone deacetylase family protein [Thermoflexales bacterium]